MQKANQIGEKTAELGESVGEGAGRIVGTARAVAENAADKMRAARDVAEEKTEEVLAWVRARPVASVLIAFGVGYLLGKIARR
jgi:ElaB/YqjD/DUF883 family membrane-anchored ribosome-binding protein